MFVEDYSDKAIVVRGDTKPSATTLKEMGGKWNANLTGGSGWIFPKTKETDVRALLTQSPTVPNAPVKPTRKEVVADKFTELLTSIEDVRSMLSPTQKLQLIQALSRPCEASRTLNF